VDYRRYYVPDAIVFITQVVENRVPVFLNESHLDLLRSTLHRVKVLHPFAMLACVFLPDHLHLLIKPTGASTYSQVMHSLKPNFTKAYKQSMGITGEMRFWQQRFWEHTIRDEEDLHRHLDYIHYNPVKHGLVAKPQDWKSSSFLAWKTRGAYPDGWGESVPPFVAGAEWRQAE
jgi:putative transposase